MNIAIDEVRPYLPSGKQIATELYGIEWRGNRARCPRAENHVHGDSDPSFVYLDKEDRFHCYSQHCFGDKAIDVFDLVRQMENLNVSGSVARLAQQYAPRSVIDGHQHNSVPKHGRDPSTRSELVREGWVVAADYEMGDDVRKVRFEHPEQLQPNKNRPKKTFLWEHRDDNGVWKPGRGGKPHQAYVNERFGERARAEFILGVESERSADAMVGFGIPAFSFKELTELNAAAFAGLNLRLLPDKDKAGDRLLHKASVLLRPHARSIALIEPPNDWPEAGDIYDAVSEMGWKQDRIDSLLSASRSIEECTQQYGDESPTKTRIWTLAELRKAKFDQPQFIVEDIIAEGETIGLIGKPKAGKSRLAQQLALAVSRGEEFLGHAVPKARRVLVLDLENRLARVRTRFQMMSGESAHDERLFIYAPETLSDPSITLGNSRGIKALDELVGEANPDLLVVDTWRLLSGGDENKTEVVVRGIRGLSSLRQRRPRLAILVLHHTRKSQRQDPPLLRVDPGAWTDNASGHHSFIAHMDGCLGLEREIDRKTGNGLIVFGGISRSMAPRTLFLDEDLDTLAFKRADNHDFIEKLLTEKEGAAWNAVKDLPEFTFSEVVSRACTTNRKLVSSMLTKLKSMNVIEHGPDGVYRHLRDKRN